MDEVGLLHVVIADPRQLMCEGLQWMLARRPSVALRAAVRSKGALFALLSGGVPDVLLLNPRLGAHGGAALIEELRQVAPALPVLVLASDADSDDPVALLKAGARGYLSRTDGPDDLLLALRKVAQGGVWVSPELGEQIAENLYGGARLDTFHELSPREAEVFCLLARGQTVSQIGNNLGLSVKTVSTHKRRVMQRLGLASLSELVRYALSHGLIDPVAEQREQPQPPGRQSTPQGMTAPGCAPSATAQASDTTAH
jgi:DNA-binding NarL/FixJ family response regulator